jgi:hypothetical protein
MTPDTAKRLAWACRHGECRAAAVGPPCPRIMQGKDKEGREVFSPKPQNCLKVTAEEWLQCTERTP